MSILDLYAGEHARQQIQQHGLQPEQIKLMVGASGGPKWLMLSRLDQYFAQHFLPKVSHPIDLLGSSVGSWRMACHSQRDPLSTFQQFENLYMDQRYSEGIPPEEITTFIHHVLDHLFTDDRVQHIVENPLRRLHVVAVRNRKLMNGRGKMAQGMGLLSAALGNTLSSRWVEWLYPRVLISQAGSYRPYVSQPETIELTAANLKQALIASGAIPMVMEPTKVEGGMNRWHWDGGLVDYHFPGPFDVDGLVFYPHFFPQVTPGWFDKGLPWKKARAQDYSNVVMVTPSQSFIDRLPYGKIPDRHDFEKLSDTDREAFWRTVLAETDHLVESFHNMMETDAGASSVQPIERIL